MDDIVLSQPLFVFTIQGHRVKYYLSRLLPYYGNAFCERFRSAWVASFCFMKGGTSQTLFKSVRKVLYAIAARGVLPSDSVEHRVFTKFRDDANYVPSAHDWELIVNQFEAEILDLTSTTFVKTTNPRSRNSFLESLRIGLRSLAQQNMLPRDVEPHGRLDARLASTPKCLATISFEAGRLDLNGLHPDAAIQAFIRRNRDMLHELKREFWNDLLDNANKFDIGRKMLADTAMPSIQEIAQVLQSYKVREIKSGLADWRFREDLQWAVALKIVQYQLHGGNLGIGHKKVNAYVFRFLSHDEAQPYLEVTSRGLNAAFHIILIETGANVQPIEDLPFEVYRGGARHGKRLLNTVKNRSAGKAVPSGVVDEKFYVSVRRSDELGSAGAAIAIYKKISAPLRSLTGPTATNLWVWRRAAGTRTIQTQNPMVNHDPWYNFLGRMVDNPVLGKLPITRMAIRKAVANSNFNTGDFDFIMQQALLGHVHPATTFGYLSEGAVRAYLVGQVREFQNSWEATSAINIDDAARLLGVPDAELIRRQRLGLESGLSFAALRSDDEPEENPIRQLLVKEARSFSVTQGGLLALELARRALWGQFERVVNSNPGRFIRTWIPWMAIVEGYCERLKASRFRVRFKNVCANVDSKLASGKLALPVLW